MRVAGKLVTALAVVGVGFFQLGISVRPETEELSVIAAYQSGDGVSFSEQTDNDEASHTGAKSNIGDNNHEATSIAKHVVHMAGAGVHDGGATSFSEQRPYATKTPMEVAGQNPRYENFCNRDLSINPRYCTTCFEALVNVQTEGTFSAACALSQYEFASQLGTGSQGQASKVKHKQSETFWVAKVFTNEKHAKAEWLVLEALTSKSIPHFVTGKEAFTCSAGDVPQDFKTNLRDEVKYYIIIEVFATKTVVDATQSDPGNTTAVVFQQWFSLLSAWANVGFQHNEVSSDNVMIRDWPANINKLRYTWMADDGELQQRCISRGQLPAGELAWIDFGYGTVGRCTESDDVPCLRKFGTTRITANIDAAKVLAWFPQNKEAPPTVKALINSEDVKGMAMPANALCKSDYKPAVIAVDDAHRTNIIKQFKRLLANTCFDDFKKECNDDSTTRNYHVD